MWEYVGAFNAALSNHDQVTTTFYCTSGTVIAQDSIVTTMAKLFQSSVLNTFLDAAHATPVADSTDESSKVRTQLLYTRSLAHATSISCA
jgi:hypothetical protein